MCHVRERALSVGTGHLLAATVYILIIDAFNFISKLSFCFCNSYCGHFSLATSFSHNAPPMNDVTKVL